MAWRRTVFPDNELVMLILGAGVLVFLYRERRHLRRVHSWRLLVCGYCLILAGWCATILEHVTDQDFFNFVEHSAYVAGALLTAAWCWRGLDAREEAE